jgi:hypothetical protein
MRYIVKHASLAFERFTNKQSHNSQRELVLDSKFSQDSFKTSELKLVMINLASLATKFLFARLASLATKFVCETHEKQVLLRNFFLRDS